MRAKNKKKNGPAVESAGAEGATTGPGSLPLDVERSCARARTVAVWFLCYFFFFFSICFILILTTPVLRFSPFAPPVPMPDGFFIYIYTFRQPPPSYIITISVC